MIKNKDNLESENNIPEQGPVAEEKTPETPVKEEVAVVDGAEVVNDADGEEFDEASARKARMRARRLERRHRRNARIARFRTLKNLFIWLLGVFFLPIAIVASMFVIPVGIVNSSSGQNLIGGKVYTGSKEEYEAHKDASDAKNAAYYKDLDKFSVLELARFLSDDGLQYTKFDNFPVIIEILEKLENEEIMEGTTFNKIVKIDIEKLKTVALGSDEIGKALSECVEVVATISTFIDDDDPEVDFGPFLFGNGEGTEYGTYGTKTSELDVLCSDAKGSDDDKANEAKNKLKALYYKPEEVTTDSSAVTTQSETVSDDSSKPKFERAFDNDGNFVKELIKPGTVNMPKDDVMLYYPPFGYVKIIDLINVFTDIIEQTKMDDVFKVLGFSGNGSDSVVDLIEKIVGKDATIKTVGEYEFSDLELSVFIDETEKNADLWKVLRAATGVGENGTVTLNDLKNINIDNIELDTFLEKKAEPNAEDYGGAESEAYKKAYDEYETNKKLWDMLDAATTPKEGGSSELTVGDLTKGLNFDNVPLSIVLKEDKTDENNTKFWKILRQATGVKEGEEVTIGNLSKGLIVDNVLLKDVIKDDNKNSNNQRLWKIITAAVTDNEGNAVTRDTVTLGDLNSRLNTNAITLSIVLDPSENAKLYSILREATGKANDSDITIGALSDFKVSNIHLVTVLDPTDGNNAKLYKILREATPVTGSTPEEQNASITLSSLSNFSITDIYLNTVLDDVNVDANDVLKALKEKNIKVSDIGSALNDLTLYEVYGRKAFVETSDTTGRVFKATKDASGNITSYDYVESPTSGETYYKIDKTAGIWLILSFDATDVDDSGNPNKYVVGNYTIGSLQSGNTFSNKFRNATLQQFIDAGLVNTDGVGDLSEKTRSLSLQKIVEVLANPFVQTVIAGMS